MRTSQLRLTASSLALVAAGVAFTPSAFAQSAAAGAGAPSQSAASAQSAESGTPTSVDQIVVTAQKRTQSLQDVPIVVTTVSRQLLQDTGVSDIKDLTLLTPGLLVTSTTSESSTSARIRGIGTVGDNVGLESSVGVTIDGVYRPRNGVGFGDLGDVDRIEVLKGPQGTLFGKSTSAGVINVLTAQPSFNYGAHAEFTAGNYGAYGGSASVTGPIIADKLAGSLYFADRQRDGFYDINAGKGPNTATDDQNRSFYSLRGQLLFLPTDQLSVRVIADYSHRDERCCAAVEVRGGPTTAIVQALAGAGGGEPTTPDPFNRLAYQNRPDVQDIHDEGLSAEINYKLPSLNANITSITAYRDWKSTSGGDVDFTNADLLYRPADDSNSDQFRDFSQELRFSGVIGKLDYTVGGYYSKEKLRSNFSLREGTDFNSYLGLLLSSAVDSELRPLGLASLEGPNFLRNVFGPNAVYPANSGSVDRYRQTDETYAFFTNDTYHITSKLDVNIGLRYTDDDKTLDSTSFNVGGAGAACQAVSNGAAIPVTSALTGLVSGLGAALEPTTCLPFYNPGFNNFSNHQHEDEQELSGTAKISYRFNPQILTYGSYARGYKAGGFNLDRVLCTAGTPGCAAGSAAPLTPVRDTSFPGEFVDSYELGAKTTLFGRTLILNSTLFRQEYSNFQLNTFNGLVFVVTSVPSVISKGLDTDFVWLPVRDLSFQGGLTIADTRYDLSATDLANLKASTGFLGSRGSRLSLAPLYSASFSSTYTHDLIGDFRVRGNVGIKFSSAYNTGSDLDPGKRQGDYALVNARVSIFPRNERYSVELWAENLFDKDYKQVAFDSGFQNFPTNATGVLDAFLGQPRTFGVTLRAKL